jgi:predicted ATPase/tetratricopeptide (TPR) repeat protein
LALWTGAPFGGFDGFGAFRDETQHLDALRLEAERVVILSDIDTGDAVSVVSHVDALVREFPFDEDLRGLYMQALYRSGRQAEALSSFNMFKSHLAEELGLDPSVELQDLELRILQHDKSLDPQHPEPPTIGRVSGLPNRYSSFVGRDTEVAETSRRMAGHPLVTLVGAGGIGKSSIALEAARDLQRGDDTVAHVRLETVGKGDVSTSVARSIGLEPAADVDPISLIAEYVATHPHIVVLDGCDAHIIEVALLADSLLKMAECSLLATSREPLGLDGESTIRIDPLPIDAAMQVFKDRAELPEHLDDETAEVVRSVCLALDGMPLAVELAAARAKTVPLDRLADRMNDQIPLLKRARTFDERHGSMLAALDWSYNLLDEAERSMLLGISAFLTPFTFEDATAMVDTPDAEDDIARLVEVSLVQRADSSNRYRLLEPIRQYAMHRLSVSGNLDAVRLRHADWIETAAAAAEPYGIAPQSAKTRAWIFEKRVEILAAVAFAHESDNPDQAVGITCGFGLELRHLSVEEPFVAIAVAAVRHPEATRDSDFTTACAHTAAYLSDRGRWDEAIAILEDGISVAEEHNDVVSLADAKQRMATIVGRGDHVPETLELIDEANELAALGESDHQEYWAYNHGKSLLFVAREADAVEVIERARDRWEQRFGVPYYAYYDLVAEVRQHEGDLETALDLYSQAGELVEAEQLYQLAADLWDEAGMLASDLGLSNRLADAVQRRRRISELTGLRLYLPLEIRFALGSEDYLHVFALARDWFGVFQAGTDEDLIVSRNEKFTIHGSTNRRPAIFGILRSLAVVLYETDRRDEACRIATSIPRLIQDSPFRYWREYREEALWRTLTDACVTRGETHQPMSLEEVFSYTKNLVMNTPTPAWYHRRNRLTSEED